MSLEINKIKNGFLISSDSSLSSAHYCRTEEDLYIYIKNIYNIGISSRFEIDRIELSKISCENGKEVRTTQIYTAEKE